ncbi:SH3 domain-containing protein [Paenibacillus chibensis]|uniref:SH3 domain-containing protein n=1 Tax=Paenibacillus chibensis TaxID=59846 RepID=UPI000FD98A37|nr:SH3 domain-containing protein [Paenibacillus chibensis]MEC0371096.1 SH3 domain-containing protein [Paenibacillus chibensis]
MNKTKLFKVVLFFMLFFSILNLQWILSTHAFDAKNTSVFDVKAAGLNVRSGPGTSYPVIAQVTQGEDIVNYCPVAGTGASCPPTSNGGLEWDQNYYPDGSIGYYANAAKGYMAWMNTGGGGTWNYNYATNAVVKRQNNIYNFACPNLNSQVGTMAPGTYVKGDYNDELRAAVCNPNAWTILSADTFISGYANGWNMSAY